MNQKKRGAQHQPVRVGKLGGLEFHRCPCGFTVVKYSGRLYWVRARPADKPPGLGGGIRQLGSPAELACALATRCPLQAQQASQQSARAHRA
jgi:hypothetical protein